MVGDQKAKDEQEDQDFLAQAGAILEKEADLELLENARWEKPFRALHLAE